MISDILLAIAFVMQKKYQGIAGTSMKVGLVYNALLGLGAAMVYLVINEFRIEISLFSVVMATLFATIVMLYVMIGFKIMEKENMSLYTLFLMCGGMTVPYVWGVLLLNEELTFTRTLGLAAIISAIIISNSGEKKPAKNQLMLCAAVFILNGFASVTSKMHQINPVSEVVTSSDFAFLTVLFKVIICMVVMLAFRKKVTAENQAKLPIKAVLPIVAGAVLADSISFVLQLVGARNLPATVLYPFVTGGSVILTSFAGIMVFKEKLSVRQWVGIAICFAGTLLFL